MANVLKLRRIGNSTGVILPKDLLAHLHVDRKPGRDLEVGRREREAAAVGAGMSFWLLVMLLFAMVLAGAWV